MSNTPDNRLQVHQFNALSDNYCYLVHDPDSKLTAVVDTPDAAPIEAALAETGWSLDYILNTHHHHDHTGGNLELKESTGCKVVGSKDEAARTPGIDIMLGEGDKFALGSKTATVHATPGHTNGHIVYHFAADDIAFTGDTLFSLGCGRLFEGTAEQMWASLQKLLAWPDETLIYCAHEYTQSNAEFALTVEADNSQLIERATRVTELRQQGQATIPSTIGLERATNPFLRPMSPNLQATLGMSGAPLVDVFAETRRRKDNF
ncbi:MAG: hydroxyacylglutathione hydrolase [Gammaproteobacteria bacterium]|jgi:hydroxyacylglutathione hydrolase|nr:hydroxyacylglutathione hydrolase [Gammaproteobacteria bacterium]MDP7296317.1 hydroxyacylglutathione hydrolase [Gammaproteobacteria bacterium]MDP7419570.1 hydroxyacylglutathione hydrolase [Gammaproteobacteria bacterium]MDP7661610.1 hydroxyacylglutathione hydrolase [Gammaproteobacteria bacterium]HJP39011.1 hydroxyacylglutathione hydrolase [Gammaproteobacteria bacterium]